MSGLDPCLPAGRLGNLAEQVLELGFSLGALAGLRGSPFGDVLEPGLGDGQLFPEVGRDPLDPLTFHGRLATALAGGVDLAAQGRATLLKFADPFAEVVEFALAAQGAGRRTLAPDGDAAGLDPEPVPTQESDARVVRRQAFRRLGAGDEVARAKRAIQVR